MAEIPVLDMCILLKEMLASESVYDKANQGGLGESFILLGHIWNTDSHFNKKDCMIRIKKGSSKVYEELARKDGLENCCGAMNIRKHLKPKEYNEAPISFNIFVEGDDYRAIKMNCEHSIENNRMLSANISVFCKDFSEKNNVFPLYENIDISTDHFLKVVRFSMSESVVKIVPKDKRIIRSGLPSV